MIGAIAGDIIGSVYEFKSKKPDYNFPLFTEESFFTDDTVLSIALAESILTGVDYKTKVLEYIIYIRTAVMVIDFQFGQAAMIISLIIVMEMVRLCG
jgi:ADP-ribosylglycohydrolase